MFHKRDPIFWTATGVFVLALVLAAVAGEAFLLLLVAAYLLRPTLHSLGLFRRLADEREMQIQYRASSVGFAAMLVGTIVVIVVLMRRGDHTWEMLVAVLMAALATRALAGLMMGGDRGVIGPRILFAIGGLVALFGLLEGAGSPGSFVSHVLPGLIVVGLGFAARRWPRPVGWVVLAVAAALIVGLLRSAVSDQPGAWGTVLALALMSVPAAVAGATLVRLPRGDAEPTSPGTPMAGLLVALALAWPAGSTAQDLRRDARFDCRARSNAALGADCRLLQEDTVYGRRMPAAAVLHFDSSGTYTFFFLRAPARFEGLELAGASDGISHDMYPDGSPRGLWLRGAQDVNGVPCRGFSFFGEVFQRTARVSYHPSGAFKGCRLGRAATIQGTAFATGDRIEFDDAGKVVPGRR